MKKDGEGKEPQNNQMQGTLQLYLPSAVPLQTVVLRNLRGVSRSAPDAHADMRLRPKRRRAKTGTIDGCDPYTQSP